MKKIFTSILFCCTVGVFAQNINIPDAAFKLALVNHSPIIDTNKDGEISVSEAEAFTGKIDVSREYLGTNQSDPIFSLQGIEAFINLTHLDCTVHGLTSLDLSKNTKLISVNCSFNSLSSLNVSKNTELISLTCFNNALTRLDVSNNILLTDLACDRNDFLTMICINPLQDTTRWSKYDIAEYSTTCGLQVNIPDANFKAALISEGVDTNNDGEIQVTEAERITSINVSTKNIASLQGIEAFINLQTLYCDHNELTSLDISKNTALTQFSCSYNQLTSLDVSKNIHLINLSCTDNQLTSLNITGLTSVLFLNCSNNKLTSLEMYKNISLTELYCFNNQLISLNVTESISLRTLHCYSNQLTKLDLSTHVVLAEMWSTDNPALTTICTNPKNIHFYWSKDITTSYSATCHGEEPSTVTIPDANFKAALLNYKTTIDTNNDKEIQFSEAAAVTELELSWKQIADMTGIEAFVNLKSLSCSTNEFTTLDLSKNTALTILVCTQNQLTELDISNQPDLILLNCYNNQLKNLDLSKNTKLEDLNCFGNQLSSLDVSNHPKLKTLICFGNQLITLNASNAISLQQILAFQNKLTSINVSGATTLEQFVFHENQLISLDISGATSLTSLECGNNQLTNLNVSGAISLIFLNCSNNKLMNLDVSGVPSLTRLYCSNNQLTSLDVSKNLALTELYCSDNPFSVQSSSNGRVQSSVTIDVSKNVALEELYCFNNNLTGLNLSNNLQLKKLDASKNPFLTEIYIQQSIVTKDFIKDDTAQWKTPITSLSNQLEETATIIKAYNLQGIEVPTDTKDQPIILLYDNGRTEKVIQY